MTETPVEYTAWYEGWSEADAEKFSYAGSGREPWEVAEMYAEHDHDRSAESPNGMIVLVKHALTKEVTRWRIVVEYDPSYHANPA